jgi:DNA polymerase III epsilon subunit-like protein
MIGGDMTGESSEPVEKPWFYLGKPISEYVPIVINLKRQNDEQELENLLLNLVRVVEEGSIATDEGVAPWYYEKLAIFYRKQGQRGKEIEILQRFAGQKHSPGVSPPRLLARLDKLLETANEEEVDIRPARDGKTPEKTASRAKVTTPRKPRPEPPLDFIALDVETATSDYASICQIGLVVFKDGVECDALKTYIDPGCEFSRTNVRIHGITNKMVQGEPTFVQYIETLRPILENQVVVHHTAFDRTAFDRACEKYGLEPINCTWLDSSTVARYAWEDCRASGYGLSDLAKRFEIAFDHHDALADARTAGLIFMRAVDDSGEPFSKWVKRRGIKGSLPKRPVSQRPEIQTITIDINDLLDLEKDEIPTEGQAAPVVSTQQPAHPPDAKPKRIKPARVLLLVLLLISLCFTAGFLSAALSDLSDTSGVMIGSVLGLVFALVSGLVLWLLVRSGRVSKQR